MIKRRSVIESTIGHMKSDGKLGRNWLKGALGEAIHAVLCGAGHNLRLIMRKLQLFCTAILAMLLLEQAVQRTDAKSIRHRRLLAEQVVWLIEALALYDHKTISEVLDDLSKTAFD